jgi:uncharacterized protein (TIGR00269 family)
MPKVLLRNPRREVRLDGARRVKVILRDLGIDPETVLVIRGDELLTREELVGADEVIEIRPVISGGAESFTKCRRCREAKAVVELRRHNTAFCKPCFLHFFTEQVRHAIKHDDMIRTDDRVLVAVSGGKDSLALWDVLVELGYRTTGYHIVLWTGEDYASESLRACREFAAARGLELDVADLRSELGFAIPDLPKLTGRPTCSACGLTKRHLTSMAAARGEFDVVATGHNVDDEAAALLGNTLRWDEEYMARQGPVLPGEKGFVKKVKPLHRLSEKETASYAFLRGIDYVVEECPLVAGNTQLRYKHALDLLESASPGTKAAFYSGFIDRAKERLPSRPEVELHACDSCGMPTPGETCAFCRMVALVGRGRS